MVRRTLPRQTSDFGQTLYVWGVRDSEYLVLSVVGPTTTRDPIGSTVEFVALTRLAGARKNRRRGSRAWRRRIDGGRAIVGG